MIGISLRLFTLATRNNVLQQLLEAEHLALAQLRKTETGKPYLELAGRQHGLAITHLRKGPWPVSLMAVSREPHIGIDAEHWPQGPCDETFLQSVSAQEDAQLIQQARACKRDPATLLWCIKESALKASGEVMHEPAELAVKQVSQDEFAVTNSKKSSAPIAETIVRCWRFGVGENVPDGLISVAFSSFSGARRSLQNLELQAPELTLAPVLQLTKD